MYDAKSRVNTKKQKQNTILNKQNKAMKNDLLGLFFWDLDFAKSFYYNRYEYKLYRGCVHYIP